MDYKFIGLKKFSQSELERKLTKHFCNVHHIDFNRQYKIYEVRARDLIHVSRLDLASKIAYVDAFVNNKDLDYASEQYKKNIEAMTQGLFIEGRSNEKNSFDMYIEIFKQMIQSICTNGVNPDISLIPVDTDFIALDGTHRISIAAYFDMNVQVIVFDTIKDCYNYKILKDKLFLDEFYLEEEVLEFCRWNAQIYMLILWPRAAGNKYWEAAIEKLEGEFPILYENEYDLSYNGIRNFCLLAYQRAEWIGTAKDHFSGLYGQADNCYLEGKRMRVFWVQAESVQSVLNFKKKLRDGFGIGNYSVHSTDNQVETLCLSRMLLNRNSLHNLDYFIPDKYNKCWENIMRYKMTIINNGLDVERFIIDSSGILEVLGIRKSGDIDYLSDYDSDHIFQDDLFENNDKYLENHNYTIKQLIYDPHNFLYFNDVKFITLENLMAFKSNKGTEKDLLDVKMIREYLKKERRMTRSFTDLGFYIHKKFLHLKAKLIHILYIFLKKVHLYKFVKKIAEKLGIL